MAKKNITIKPKKNFMPSEVDKELELKLDQWVTGELSSIPTNKTNKEETYRFTVVIPTYLHRRIKKHCAVKGLKMKDVISEILENEFPET